MTLSPTGVSGAWTRKREKATAGKDGVAVKVERMEVAREAVVQCLDVVPCPASGVLGAGLLNGLGGAEQHLTH